MLCISILAPRMWGDDTVDNRVTDIWHFNPRPTYVRRQMLGIMWEDIDLISILAPRMWGDLADFTPKEASLIFQSSPHVCEATACTVCQLYKLRNFNPRPTYVRRPFPAPYLRPVQSFQSSPHVCEATYQVNLLFLVLVFQSSPHVCEATSLWRDWGGFERYFNPRPTYVRRRAANG